MTDQSEIVVVGGGIMGASVALHLLESGASSVRLLERDGLFEGTSGAGGGFLAPWSVLNPMHGADSAALPIERYGMEFYEGLHKAGYDVDFRRNGVLWVAASESSWGLFQEMAWSTADPASYPADAAKMHELTGGVITSEGPHRGHYIPSGSQITVSKAGTAIADRITKLGGIIETRRPVTGIRVSGDRVTGVETPTGNVDCATVVVAAGAWSNALLAPVGAFLPTVPQVTSRIITEPIDIPETMPVLMIIGVCDDEPGGGTPLWVRWHHGGLLWGGMYSTYPRNILVDQPVPDRLDELPTDGIAENQRVAAEATFIPVLSKKASIRVKHGAPCYTPDDLALVGPVPEVDGLYAVGGDNELGVTHGPGIGKALAEQIVHGTSEFVDLKPFRIDRFGGRFTNETETFKGVAESVHELLAVDRL